jgi:hypothetical protein
MENTTMNNDGIDFAEAKSAADKILEEYQAGTVQVRNLCRAYLALEKEKAAAEDAKLRQERESVRKEVIDAILRDEARDAVAPGWNPQRVTRRQLGEGWRLLERDEIDVTRTEFQRTTEIEWWNLDIKKWDSSGWAGSEIDFTYRTQKPAGFFLPKDPLDDVAEGHNPGQLTKRQVGYQYGWRTLSQDEAMCHDPSIDRTDAQLWQQSENKWKERYFPKECFSHDTYRTRKPKGYYLPKPKPKLVPFTAATFPKGEVWVRHDIYPEGLRDLVTYIGPDHVGRNGHTTRYDDKDWEYSLDGGRTWLPWGTLEGGAK